MALHSCYKPTFDQGSTITEKTRLGAPIRNPALLMPSCLRESEKKNSSRKPREQARLPTPRYRRGMRVYVSVFPRTPLLGLPGTLLGCLYAALPVGEHRVHEGHVGAYRLLRDLLPSLLPTLLLVGQLPARLSVLLSVGTQVVYGLVEEDLGNLGALLLGRGAALGDHLVGLYEGIGELIGGLVYPLLALLVGHKS